MPVPIRVLLVEHDPDHALLARSCLTSDAPPGEPRVEVTHVGSLAEALTRLREREHQAVLLELALPDARQLDALRPVVRAAPSIPVVVLTSCEDEVVAAAAIGFGAHDYLIKQQLSYPSLPRVVRQAVARNQLSRRLADSQGAVSLSALGASLTHEINNALAYVSSNLDFLAENFAELARRARSLEALTDHADEAAGPGPESADWFKMLEAALSDARHGASRIETVVATLRDFSLQDTWDGSPVDLRDVLEKALRLAMNEITHRCRLVRDYQATPSVRVDPRALGQVLLTLFAYVAQSLPDDRGERNRVVVRVAQDGEGNAIIVLEDNGRGMPQEVVEQLFDPVHVMKPEGLPGKLGLFVAHRILAELGGTIAVQSEETQGTCFRITLQSAVEAETGVGRDARGRANRSDSEVVTRRGRVLVVDDEQAIGAAICRLLEGDHDVTLPADASEALELLERSDPYDVVFCDLMMPGLSGMELYEMTSRPEVRERFVFMTAGTFSERADAFLRSDHVRCIQKPFDRDTLRAAVSEGMQQRGNGRG